MLSCVLIIYFLLVFHWINISQFVYPLFYRLISRLFPNFGCYKSGRSEQSCVRFLCVCICVHMCLYIQTYLILLHFVLLCFRDTSFLQIEGLWQPCIDQVLAPFFQQLLLTYFMHLSHILVIFAIFQALHQKGSDDSIFYQESIFTSWHMHFLDRILLLYS